MSAVKAKLEMSYSLTYIQVLQMPAKQRKKFLGRWHPTSIAWWDDSKVVVARASGGVTILDSAGDFAHNVLGPSAEFFAPGVKMAKNASSSSAESNNGFFLLEVAAPVKEGLSDESVVRDEFFQSNYLVPHFSHTSRFHVISVEASAGSFLPSSTKEPLQRGRGGRGR